MGEVIRTAAENPVPLPDADAVKDNLAKVINATYEQYGADAQMIAHAEDPAGRPRQGLHHHLVGVRPHHEPAAGRQQRAAALDDSDVN